MLRQGTAEGLCSNWPLRRGRPRLFDSVRGLEFFKLQFELLDLAEHLLALRPEKQALQLVDQQFEPFDLGRA
jgi:hypothetical protein